MRTPPVRRHGFTGQHMVVLPAPIRHAAAAHPLLRSLLVTDAGYFPQASGHRVERPQGSATHLLIVCLQGRGWVRGDERAAVGPGDVVWLASDHPHAYGADEDSPWTIVWAHFRGEELPHWQRELGWSSRQAVWMSHLTTGHAADLGLDHVYELLERGDSVPQLLEASAALRATFCATIRLTQGSAAARSSAERTALVRDQLARHPARAYRLKELATGASLSVAHFSLLFRQQTGYSPIDYLIRQRIKSACRFLDSSRAGIAQIAAEVGFSDPYYFSRCFRQIMGCSPGAYRKAVKA